MLADASVFNVSYGALGTNIYFGKTSVIALIGFLADQLSTWCEDPERQQVSSETTLTSQFCAYLNEAARFSSWDFLQFRVEERDERKAGRKIDLVAAPCGATVWVEGRRCTKYDPLLPVECKRLPTPVDKRRDPREYVVDGKTTGGIQRFKSGHHGAAHTMAAMIGYIQANDAAHWKTTIDGWIQDLISTSQPGWSVADILIAEPPHASPKVSLHRSDHSRSGGLPDINLTHIWVQLSGRPILT